MSVGDSIDNLGGASKAFNLFLIRIPHECPDNRDLLRIRVFSFLDLLYFECEFIQGFLIFSGVLYDFEIKFGIKNLFIFTFESVYSYESCLDKGTYPTHISKHKRHKSTKNAKNQKFKNYSQFPKTPKKFTPLKYFRPFLNPNFHISP